MAVVDEDQFMYGLLEMVAIVKIIVIVMDMRAQYTPYQSEVLLRMGK